MIFRTRRRRIVRRIRRPRSIFHTHSHRQYLAHRESTRALVIERIAHFNTHYKVPVGRIAIRNQRSRWGSCSKKGNLNFNYKLAFLPVELRDYVIVHELCHLREFNHGPNFWYAVAEVIPNHRELNKKLREISSQILPPHSQLPSP